MTGESVESDNASPAISRLLWGRIELADGRAFKDVKLFPGGAHAWDWRESGTDHSPGIAPADVAELVENGAKIVILSQGMVGRLGVRAETIDLLRRSGVETHILRTERAVQLYNELRVSKRVGGLFHTTC